MEAAWSAVEALEWWDGLNNSVSSNILYQKLIFFYHFPEQPAFVSCPYSNSEPTFASETDTDDNTVAAGATPAGCKVAKKYEQLVFASCSHSEPDATDKTHLEVKFHK